MTPRPGNADWESFLAERPIAVLATAGSDGLVHAVPVEVIVLDGRAYVWCEAASVKARNASREGRATIMAYKGQAGVMLRGPARLIDRDGERYEEVSQLFLAKYQRQESFGNDLLIEITPQRVTRWE